MASVVHLTKSYCSKLESGLCCHSERAKSMQSATTNGQGFNVRVTVGRNESHDLMLDSMPLCRTSRSVQS
jgi:hypothetical protein